MKKCFFYIVSFFAILCLGSCQNKATQEEPISIKIACVGNSITYGAGMANREMNAYPQQLQAMLGDTYQVENFGVNGNTLLKKGDTPYWASDRYKEALAFSPDIVFVKLGTNDTKQQNRVYLDTDFDSDYKELIASFKAKNKDVRVVLLLPVPSFVKDLTGIWNPIIKDQIIPLTQKVAYDTQSEVIDLYQLFVGEPNLFPDTIHPSSLGATRIAKRVYEAVIQEVGSSVNVVNSLSIHKKQESNFYGFIQTDFKFKGVDCKIVRPKNVAKGAPWVLRARFWGHEPQTDIALLERGFHIAYCDVANLFGGEEAVERWNAFYALMTNARLAKKVVLEGLSRGGLIIYNWAVENPEKVACIYADAPVLDGFSWPGGAGKGKGSPEDLEDFKNIYELHSEASINSFTGNPIHKTRAIAQAGFPMFHVCGEADMVVPVSENTALFEREIKDAGGHIKVIYKPGVGHHPHSLKNPTPIVDFILRATNKKINFAVLPAPGSEYRSAAGWVEGKDWWAQANDIDSLCMNSGKVDLLLIGNSITQGFGGNRSYITHYPGKKAVETYFDGLKIIGAGISGDRTQHVAWRMENGHYDECEPDFISLAIGVNNFGDNTANEVAEGIRLNIALIQEKLPNSTVLFFGPLPTGLSQSSDRRKKYDKIHELIAPLGNKKSVHYYNMMEFFSDKNGTLNSDYYSSDEIHLKPKGYEVWAEFIRDKIKTLR
ncbi:MAG: GDSL-type esterase/lipase family protein [Flavobacteriaceae bacterium]